jgi:hypothetical protein
VAALRPWHKYRHFLPPLGRSQLMRPPPARPHKNTKEIRYIVARASTLRPYLGTVPFLPRPRPACALLSSLVLAQLFPALVLRLFVILVSRILVSRQKPSLPVSESQELQNSRSYPNSCAMEVFRSVRFPPVALPMARHIMAWWSLHWRQCLKRCSRVCDDPEPELVLEHHQHLSSAVCPTSAR